MSEAEKKLIEVDGSVLEGGGQVLRMSSVFSVLLRQPIRIINIRANRSKGGLRPQHLKGLELLAEMSGGRLVNGVEGATTVELWPGVLRGGNFLADPRTAGSITLLIQTALPCALFAPSPVNLTLRGGTNVDFAPQIEFLTDVLAATLENIFDIRFNLTVTRRGYYPKGGGEVAVSTEPIARPVKSGELIDRGDLSSIEGISWVAGTLPISMSRQAMESAKNTLVKSLKPANPNVPVKIQCDHKGGGGNGNGIILKATTSSGRILAGDSLGKRGVSPKDLGISAAKNLLKAIDDRGCVCEHLQDQLIIFMALASGTSRMKTGPLTMHTKTAIYIAELLTPAKFTVTEDSSGDGTNEVVCEGISFGDR